MGGLGVVHGVPVGFKERLFLLRLLRALDTIPALDHVRLKAYRPRGTVELEEQAASIAED